MFEVSLLEDRQFPPSGGSLRYVLVRKEITLTITSPGVGFEIIAEPIQHTCSTATTRMSVSTGWHNGARMDCNVTVTGRADSALSMEADPGVKRMVARMELLPLGRR